jgi:signal transduction histidine kinase
VPVALTVEGDCVLQPDVQVALYRIAQEALNNMAKHARADRAAVELHCRPNLVMLRITDDGQGFEPASVSPDHLGIGIMRERAKAIGAVIEIESRPGCGTRVVITWQDTEREGVQ